MTARYELLEQEIKQLKERNDELQTAVDATRERLAQKKQQLGEIERITGEITPFLEELYTKLAVAQQQALLFFFRNGRTGSKNCRY